MRVHTPSLYNPGSETHRKYAGSEYPCHNCLLSQAQKRAYRLCPHDLPPDNTLPATEECRNGQQFSHRACQYPCRRHLLPQLSLFHRFSTGAGAHSSPLLTARHDNAPQKCLPLPETPQFRECVFSNAHRRLPNPMSNSEPSAA